MKEQRLAKILEILTMKQSIRTSELIQLLGYQESTIRRDLKTLEETGYIRKVHGGVILDLDVNKEELFSTRLSRNSQLKQAIAQKALPYLQDDMTIYLDSGSTTHHLIPLLKQFHHMTVITNSIDHLKRLCQLDIQCVLIGGTLKLTTQAIVGSYAVSQLTRFHFDLGIFGCNGFNKSKAEVYTVEPNEGAMKEQAFLQSKKRLVLAEKKKENTVNTYCFSMGEPYILLTEDE